MSKREYYNTCRDMARTRRGLEYLYACLRDPSPQMTKMRCLLIQAAIRDVLILG